MNKLYQSLIAILYLYIQYLIFSPIVVDMLNNENLMMLLNKIAHYSLIPIYTFYIFFEYDINRITLNNMIY